MALDALDMWALSLGTRPGIHLNIGATCGRAALEPWAQCIARLRTQGLIELHEGCVYTTTPAGETAFANARGDG